MEGEEQLSSHRDHIYTFIISFDGLEDKDKVFSRRPWLFDNQLIVLKPFDGSTQLSKFLFQREEF